MAGGKKGSGSGVGARRASHAGSWYSAAPETLRAAVAGWIANADAADTSGVAEPQQSQAHSHLRALLVPHAGLSYSGATAAHAYKALSPEVLARFDRIIVLGPSHHEYLSNAAFSVSDVLETPLGPMQTDREFVSNEMSAHPHLFTSMSRSTDEAEHSIELQFPFLAHALSSLEPASQAKVVCLMIGNLSESVEKQIGHVAGQWLTDPKNLFVISSDFCHWGERFRYTRGLTDARSEGIELWQWIKHLDHRGLDIIQRKDGDAFRAYLAETKNTICGRFPIGVFLRAIECVGSGNFTVHLKSYAQSSKSLSQRDSSVSYAAAQIFGAPR